MLNIKKYVIVVVILLGIVGSGGKVFGEDKELVCFDVAESKQLLMTVEKVKLLEEQAKGYEDIIKNREDVIKEMDAKMKVMDEKFRVCEKTVDELKQAVEDERQIMKAVKPSMWQEIMKFLGAIGVGIGIGLLL
jgi:preprotein translocase subunit Sss1